MRPCIILLALPLLLGGCASVDKAKTWVAGLRPYKMDIIQGNVVTKEQAERVKPGMTRLQVRDVLGTPLLTDPFHVDRWDYIFTMTRQGVPDQRRDVVVLFDGERLKSIDAPELPSEREFIAAISKPRDYRVPALVLTPAQIAALPAPKQAAAAPADAASAAQSAPARVYPPLEAS